MSLSNKLSITDIANDIQDKRVLIRYALVPLLNSRMTGSTSMSVPLYLHYMDKLN